MSYAVNFRRQAAMAITEGWNMRDSGETWWMLPDRSTAPVN